MSKHRIPVLVLDDSDRGELGLVRSLGIAGIPVHLLTHRPGGEAASSRYVSRLHAFPPPHLIQERLQTICEVAADLGDRPPIMMAGDGTLDLVSEHRAELAGAVRHDLPELSVVRTCFNKDQFGPRAAELGLPVPRTVVAQSADQVNEVADELEYPVFVKPFTKSIWARLPKGVVEEEKGQKVDDADALRTLFGRLHEFHADSAIVQHYVPSADSEHYSVLAYVAPDGTFLGGFSTRKIRVWPPHRGVGCMVTSEVVEELMSLTRDILARLGYTGFALVQFKRDSNTGKYILLEINCRFSTSGELAARCGSNFPAVSYAILTETAVPPITQREGPSWLDLERDLSSMKTYRELGEWSWPGYIRSLASVRYPAYLAIDDPRPFFRKSLRLIRRRLRKGDP